MGQTKDYQVEALSHQMARSFEQTDGRLEELRGDMRGVREEMERQARKRREDSLRRWTAAFDVYLVLMTMLIVGLAAAAVTKRLAESTIVTLPATFPPPL